MPEHHLAASVLMRPPRDSATAEMSCPDCTGLAVVVRVSPASQMYGLIDAIRAAHRKQMGVADVDLP